MPARVIADTRLTALDIRCLAAISIHDGMSLVKGTGLGCYAKIMTLAEMARTDVANFSKSVSRLIKWGYVVREPQLGDKRRFTHRVVFGDDDSWRTDQLSHGADQGALVGELANDQAEIVGEAANETSNLVGDAEYLSDRNCSRNSAQYISSNEEKDFDESSEINSDESAHLAFRETQGEEPDWVKEVFAKAKNGKKNGAEAPATSGVSLVPHLSPHFRNLEPAAQLVRFEEAFAAIGRNADALDSRERDSWSDWLLTANDEFSGTPTGHHAARLFDEVARY